jgi:predicted secreted Zn-dependent protease
MSEPSRQRLGTISILLGAIPVLALVSWFVFYTPCGHPRRTIIEGAMFWGTIVAVPFGIFAAVKEKPRKRALIGLTLGLVPVACCIVLIIAIVYSVATGGRGLSGILDVNYSTPNGAPMTFETGVFVTTDTKYYDVKGVTMQDLEAETSRSGPHGFIAETVPYYHWNYTYQFRDGSCRIEKVRVDTKIVFTYPRWNDQPADGALTEEWTKSLAQLQQHEGEHERIARNAGREIYDTLVQLAPAPSCAELEKEIEARAQAVIAKEHEANDEFDRVTDHGKRLAEGNHL